MLVVQLQKRSGEGVKDAYQSYIHDLAKFDFSSL